MDLVGATLIAWHGRAYITVLGLVMAQARGLKFWGTEFKMSSLGFKTILNRDVYVGTWG